MTRLVQACAWFPPQHTGGSEIYVHGLARGLAERRVESLVVAPRPAADLQPYEYYGVPVAPYPALAEVGAAAQRQALAEILRAHPGAIYHQHSWTPDCGADQLALAKSLGHPTVLTVHVPSVLCLRGTMMMGGREPCDGRIEVARCARCWAQSRGAPAAVARMLAAVPAPIAARASGGGSRLATALGASAQVRDRIAEVARMAADADRVVAVCGWLHRALAANGVAQDRLSLSRQGVSAEFANLPPRPRRPIRRLLFVGRISPVKGVDVVVRALRGSPGLPVQLTIMGPEQGPEERAYGEVVRRLAEGDERIAFAAPAGRDRLAAIMGEHDALVIPSTWMETGPLVALEALAAGLWVMGSDLGGISELIDEPWKGALVRAGDVEAWRLALERHAGIEPPPAKEDFRVRTMADAAADMVLLYRDLAA